MFEHHLFDKYTFEKIPLGRDIFVMNEIFIKDYENMLLELFDGGEYKHLGYISYFAARKINANSVEMSWYPNLTSRFHEVAVSLPRDQFIICVGSRDCDERPRIFVKSEWLESLYLRNYSVFGLVDAIGVKDALECGSMSREKLVMLRNRIDLLSEKYPEIAFITFADSLLIKNNWSVEYSKKGQRNTYRPEVFIHLVDQLNQIYSEVLGLSTYAVLTQGQNEYYADSQLHVSDSGNHISLNSLGIPFAELMSIEAEARKAIKENLHMPAELYMDELYYHSLKFKYGFEKHENPSNNYSSKMKNSPSQYYYASRENIIRNLDESKSEHRK